MHSLQLSAFAIMTLLLVLMCWRNLQHRESHGFYRLFALICLAALFALNAPVWFTNRWSTLQLVSWLLLFTSLAMVLLALHELHRMKKRTADQAHPANFGFENTAELTEKGIYRYIRHPMYLSLILLCWGICLKQPGSAGLALATMHTVLIWKTVAVEEGENLRYFGSAYQQYILRTHRFIPRIL